MPFLVVIDLQCSLGLVCVLAENWLTHQSKSCLANYPIHVSKFIIKAFCVFLIGQ